MDNLRQPILTFSKAQLSAMVATAVDFGITIFLAEVCGMWYALATFIGAVSGGLTNCVVNYRWVFQAHGLKKKRVALRYVIVWSGSIGLNTLGTVLLTEISGISFIIVKIIVACIVAVFWNYNMQRAFVFHKPKTELK